MLQICFWLRTSIVKALYNLFMNNLLNLESFRSINLKNEILAGLTVAMTMIPESLSFAILAGLSPLMGLYAAFLMGIVTAVLGGRLAWYPVEQELPL